MRYIRTKDGRIVDIEKFINEEKNTPYYKDFIFEEITKDGVLEYTAVGTEKCSIKDQIGIKCHFSATLDSEVIKQADTIEELFDELVTAYDICAGDDIEEDTHEVRETLESCDINIDYVRRNYSYGNGRIYGAIWINGKHGEPILKSVARMNKKGGFELL